MVGGALLRGQGLSDALLWAKDRGKLFVKAQCLVNIPHVGNDFQVRGIGKHNTILVEGAMFQRW